MRSGSGVCAHRWLNGRLGRVPIAWSSIAARFGNCLAYDVSDVSYRYGDERTVPWWRFDYYQCRKISTILRPRKMRTNALIMLIVLHDIVDDYKKWLLSLDLTEGKEKGIEWG